MKKLLLLLALIGGNICSSSNQQSLFAEFTAYKHTPLDPDKISLAASIIPVQHKSFFKSLARLDDEGELTHENILWLINNHYNLSDRKITSIKNCHIGEILKSQKNRLTSKMRTLKLDVFWLGDDRIEDYIDGVFAGTTMLVFSRMFRNDESAFNPLFAGIGGVAILGSLYKLYQYHGSIRVIEKEMDTIDMLIQKIEAIELEESVQ